MDTKEKTVSKEELCKLIDEGEFAEFFEAIEYSQWYYPKEIYERLKKEFILDRGDSSDFDVRLRVFVSTLKNKPLNNNLSQESEELDIIDILEKTRKLKFNTLLLKILYLSFWFGSIIVLNGLAATFSYSDSISLTSPIFILLGIMNIVVLICAILPPVIAKYSSEIYQFLVPIANLQYFRNSVEESKVIEKVQDAVVSFAVFKGNVTERRLSYLIVVGLIVFSFSIILLKDKSGKIKPQPTQTYIYSPSFDSLLQNDKKAYQYVDSLIQKYKK